MDDRDVIRAFITDGARQGLGPSLHIERDGLLLDGWWHAAFRVSSDAFIVRVDDPPENPAVMEEIAQELRARGLQDVGRDYPLVTALTYAQLSLGGGVSWALWATDQQAGQEALAARLNAESFLDGSGESAEAGWVSSVDEEDLSAELEGARRTVGLPPTVIVAVGLPGHQVQQLRAALPTCRVETFDLHSPPEGCGVLSPTLVLVDATARTGREFVMELRASACGRFLPVAALTDGQETPLGADVALDADVDPHMWLEPIRQLLP